MKTRVALALTAAALVFAASAKAADVKSTLVSYRTPDPAAPLTVRGTLRIPKTAADRTPAVLILHGSGGVDGRGAYHAEALNEAGIATLEIDMWGARGLKGGPSGRPKSLAETLPDTYGALLFLADTQGVDPQRIGVMGFSWGGGLSLLTASAALTETWTGGRAKFAAHAPFYPVCWAALRRYHERFSSVTGAPVHIFAGERDDYDEPDTCQKFLDSLGDEPRKAFALTVYPGATHGWDGQGRGVTFHDPNGALGKGAQVRLYPDARVAARSRREAVAFFLRAFGMPAP